MLCSRNQGKRLDLEVVLKSDFLTANIAFKCQVLWRLLTCRKYIDLLDVMNQKEVKYIYIEFEVSPASM
jgi:hypothetical protein